MVTHQQDIVVVHPGAVLSIFHLLPAIECEDETRVSNSAIELRDETRVGLVTYRSFFYKKGNFQSLRHFI